MTLSQQQTQEQQRLREQEWKREEQQRLREQERKQEEQQRHTLITSTQSQPARQPNPLSVKVNYMTTSNCTREFVASAIPKVYDLYYLFYF